MCKKFSSKESHIIIDLQDFTFRKKIVSRHGTPGKCETWNLYCESGKRGKIGKWQLLLPPFATLETPANSFTK